MSMIEAPARPEARPTPFAVEHGETPVRRFTLARTGRRPVRFQGWQIMEAQGQTPGVPVSYDINLYETQAGTVVVELLVHRSAIGEPDLSHVEAFASLGEAASWLEAYAPAGDLAIGGAMVQSGAPLAVAALQAVQLRQRLARIEDSYRALVSQVLFGLDLAEDPDAAPASPEAPAHAAE